MSEDLRAEVLRLSEEKRRLTVEIARLISARGCLPICSVCYRIRCADGSWMRLDAYIQRHSQVRFTHTFCARCADRLYPGLLGEKATHAGGHDPAPEASVAGPSLDDHGP